MSEYKKIEFGDFQTPIDLTRKITNKLSVLGVEPDIVFEPTCGIGNFLQAASETFKSASKLIGIELNPTYIKEARNNETLIKDYRIQIYQDNFFNFNWNKIEDDFSSRILFIGNFPWVTNSRLGLIKGGNLPSKSNFQNHQGLNAITGKSNFDISEWMLIKTVDWLQNYDGYLAMLCKTSVARKVLNYIQDRNINLSYCATYEIDTKKYFKASVKSCLLYCKFDNNEKQYFCDIFLDMNSNSYHRIGYYDNFLVKDINSFKKVSLFYTSKTSTKWRSGIKHDCSKVMELVKKDGDLINGFGEIVDLENTFLYPLLKSSDIANNKIHYADKYVIVTQKAIGDSTDVIEHIAPKTWNYLSKYSQLLDDRKSRIYKNKPQYSIFGVGDYSFKKWKIAISGLYKRLDFRLVGEINNKPTFFDDTVYFISFSSKEEANSTFQLLNNEKIISFYFSLIFWDDKRPIKASILNKLNLKKAKEQINN